uniref:Gustatory receptor n=1 Tax=Tetranychus urticae TaxID=32264 RepID=A0A158P5P2_TETUR
MMDVAAKRVDNKILNYFSNYLNAISSYFIAILDSNALRSKVRNIVRRTERLTIIFQVVRIGFNQTNIPYLNAIGYRRLKLMDWVIAFVSLVNVLRMTVLIFNTNETVAIYLGDFFFRSKDRIACLTWTSMAIAIMFAFREWVLNLEAKGKLQVLSICNDYKDGFNLITRRMRNRNIQRFRSTIFFVSLILYYAMVTVPIFMTILFFTPLLTNPWTYKIPRLAFFGTFWLFSVIFAAAFLLNHILGFGWYILCAFSFHLFQFLDLLDWANLLLENNNVLKYTEKDIQSFCLLIIRRLNSFEMASFKLRYVIFSYVIGYSFVGDIYIFLGVIVRVYSDFLANLLTIIGVFILPTIGVFGFVLGNFITELDKLTIRLHQLTIIGKFSVNTMSKIMEIMDRVAGPYNGVKIGDFITLEKTFFILFILENISTLMLFTVNIGPLISK